METTRLPHPDPAVVAAATARLARALGPLSFIDRPPAELTLEPEALMTPRSAPPQRLRRAA